MNLAIFILLYLSLLWKARTSASASHLCPKCREPINDHVLAEHYREVIMGDAAKGPPHCWTCSAIELDRRIQNYRQLQRAKPSSGAFPPPSPSHTNPDGTRGGRYRPRHPGVLLAGLGECRNPRSSTPCQDE